MDPLVRAFTLPVILQTIATATFIAGAIFAAIQIRHYRVAREHAITVELLRSLQTPDFVKALRLMFDLDPGLSRDEIETRIGPDMYLLYTLMNAWENLGVLVFHREIRLDLVDDFISGSLILSWRKLQRYVKEEREARGRETLLEWFQWLAERMEERERDHPVVPAYRAHSSWRP